MRVKSIAHLILVLSFLVGFSSCNKKHTEDLHEHDSDVSASGDPMNWDEMDAFHLLMAECFHPFKDSANLAPAKQYAQELADKAQAWSSAPVPAIVDTDEVKGMIQSLKESTSHFAETVKTGDDKTIEEELNRIHDDFHRIQEAWYSARHGEAGSEHH